MSQAEEIFKEAGAVMEGHFELTSGLHSATYWEKFRVLNHPEHTERLCRMIARHFAHQGIHVVAGPTLGGIIIAFEVARQLGVRSAYAERQGDGRAFKRDFAIAPEERVLIVDDVLTTGTSILEVMEAVKRHGGDVVGVGVLIDRSRGEAELGVPLFSCHQVSIATYTPEECPLCAEGIPLTKPGGNTGVTDLPGPSP